MNRDLAIDATRGLAIWSMISLHFAAGTRIAAPTHVYPYVDGMSAFVLLSGLVLGLVYRRWIERHSLGFAYRRLTRRIVVLYLCQLTIALTAVAAGMAGHRWLTLLLPVDDWWHGLELAITMRYLPSGGNILLLYMLLMASAYLLFPLLMRNRWQLVFAGSVLAYAISLMWSPDWFYVTSFTAGHRIQNWAAWQIMFVPAVVVGWKWRDWDVAGFVDRHLAPIIVVAVGFAVILHLGVDAGPWIRFEPALADKLDFPPCARSRCVAGGAGGLRHLPAPAAPLAPGLVAPTGDDRHAQSGFVCPAGARAGDCAHPHSPPTVEHRHLAVRRGPGVRVVLGLGGVPPGIRYRQTPPATDGGS